jgi:hypothetical protein
LFLGLVDKVLNYQIARMSNNNMDDEYREEHEESRVHFSAFIEVLPSASGEEGGFDQVEYDQQRRSTHELSEVSYHLLQAEEASLGSLPGYVGASATGEMQVSEPSLFGIEDKCYENSTSRYVLAHIAATTCSS